MLSFFPRDVLDEILNLIESVSEGFPSYSATKFSSLNDMTAFAGLVSLNANYELYKDFL